MADTATANLDRLNRALLDYQRVRVKLTWMEVLEKKGRDLSVQLYLATNARQWGGAGKIKRKQGLVIATAEMRARAAMRIGTRLRPDLLKEYEQQARTLSRETRSGVSRRNRTVKSRDKLSLWQSYVGREIGLRAKGIGVLSVGWLWFRKRSSQSRGTFYVRNKTGRKLGWAHIGENSLWITNRQDGIAEVVERYGIVRQAENAVLKDIGIYMARKQGRAIGLALLEAGLPTNTGGPIK